VGREDCGLGKSRRIQNYAREGKKRGRRGHGDIAHDAGGEESFLSAIRRKSRFFVPRKDTKRTNRFVDAEFLRKTPGRSRFLVARLLGMTKFTG
jgi:hypothetical protein